MCSRLIGRLLGTPNPRTDHRPERTVSFCAYRAAGSASAPMAYTSRIRFRCTTCGGTGALDELEFFSTYDEAPLSPEDDEPGQSRRGPRPRPPRFDAKVQSGAIFALGTI
jgi:hypothetical protein